MNFTKDPDARLDYQLDWSDWLPTGDTITAVSIVADTGLTMDTPTFTTTTATAWASGGTAGETYDVRYRITTAAGRIDDRTIHIRVRQR